MTQMTVLEREEMYQSVKKLCYKKAHYYAGSTDLDFDSALSEIHLAFMKACDKWDSERASFLTYFNWVCTSHTRSYFRKSILRKMDSMESVSPEIVNAFSSVDTCPDSISDLFSEASELVKVIIKSVLETPEVLKIVSSDTPYLIKTKIKTKMREDYNVKEREFVKLFGEIREILYA